MPVSGSSPGRLLVIGILSLLVGHISSETWSNEVSDVQYGRLGSSVTLACRGRSPVEWRVNGSSVLPPQAVLLDSSLTLPSALISMEGNYSCHDPSGTLIQATRLRLGNPPGPVNISCRLPSHFVVWCSWTTTVDSTLATQYFSTYSSRDNGVVTVQECVQEEPGRPSCVIEHPPMWSPRHLLNITEVNPLGSQQTIVKVEFFQLIKPDPPEAVRSMEVEGHPTKLLVHWRTPESWTPEDISDVAFPLAFQLRYRPVGSKFWSMLFTEDNTSLMIMDALAGHPHHIQVQAKDGISPESQWSDWSQLILARPWIDSEPLLVTEETTIITYVPPENHTWADTSTVKGADSQLPDGGGLGVVMLLSLFAGIVGIVAFTVILLLWMRHQKRGGLSKQQLTSMVKVKSLLI
ncbi:interleukin-11 receptor subunit alpha isoform X3 [Sardina pilchardus]|uniref:interleukin-11 receptor subunit alpha isoform X3 n=1 Tax=Sardina pilchardus TaxID=27697 RepID=UPI002E14885D